MTLRRPSATLLIPLLIASPMLTLGPYGVSAGEVLVVLAGLLYLIDARTPVGLPTFVLIYLVLLTMGRLTSLANAPAWGIPVGVERISFLYLLCLPVLAYLAGVRSELDLEAIATTRLMVVIMSAVAIFAIAYPFLDVVTRKAVLIWFVPVQYLDSPRYDAPRFPGLGINANVYAFMVLVPFLFSLSAYLKGKASLAVPALTGLTILMTSGRIAMFCALLGGAALLWSRWRSERRRRRASGTRPVRRTRRLLVYVVALAIVGVALSSVFKEQLTDVWSKVVFVDRVRMLFDPQTAAITADGDLSELDVRFIHWRLGMQRVKLAPFLGIAPNIYVNSDTDVVLFSAPHNEFIFYWTAYGFLGLLATVYLVAALIFMNIRRRTGLTWLALYGALIVQMTFDGALQYVRFLAMFFVVVGLNVREWKLSRAGGLT
jgi:O-antigen ligase/polysaccharide polymerase Wzy-like membrane protein